MEEAELESSRWWEFCFSYKGMHGGNGAAIFFFFFFLSFFNPRGVAWMPRFLG